ncbi:MAG: DUF1501 domain-containing protein [Bryobacterales bacterium]|nr:DUF1501 domain-containing protein [Bryobacterales bacterium]
MRDRFGIDWSEMPGVHLLRRPHLTRRWFFRHAASAVGGYALLPSRPMETVAQAAAQPKGTAKYVVMVNMTGGPSHIDTFDLKEGAWTPSAFEPTSFNGVRWPRGLFPKLAGQLESAVLVRSVQSWSAVHGLSQAWMQIGRNPVPSVNKYAPHIGSVVSLELAAETADKPLPAFLSLNSGNGPENGYLAPEHGPFYVNPGGNGLGNTAHPAGPAAYDRRYELLMQLDAEERALQTLGAGTAEMVSWNLAARRLMYNSEVDGAFRFTTEERARYGNSGFGNACLAARNLLKAGLGPRFIQINIGGWDNHNNIYTGPFNAANAASLARQFDAGLATLMEDLKGAGLFDQTLVLALGEFGRTIGALNTTSGRDHFLQQAVFMAGAGIQGGRAIGSTDTQGRATAEPGWSYARDIRSEDIEATIYSALGIDWTKIRYDYPAGRGFEYVPRVNNEEFYYPIHELWG